MPNLTPNFSFYLPLVNNPTDQDLWGGYLNDNFDSIDTLLLGTLESGDFVWSALSSKTGFLICGAQAVSRTTYASLFSAIGTTFGSGDGSTTFNVPDGRGVTFAGVDNMGGTAANRITNAVCGITGTTLGALGGNQSMQQHNHTASSNVTDPGHSHPTWYTSNGAAAGSPNYPCGASGSTNTSTATTGISVATTVANNGSGSSQNVQPTMMMNLFIKT